MENARHELPTRELLVEQTEWLRNLARRLVDDVHQADDLAQDTLVAALEHPPEDGSNPRGWLKRVMQNLRADRYRSGQARSRREAASARSERLPGTDELLERVQTGRRVTDFLMELDEPFRTTLLLRFYENLPPRRIAARQGVSVATVKSRITRGLAKLRERMDRDFGGGRRAWIAALAPFAREAKLLGAATVGGIAVNTKLIAIAATVAAGAGAWLLLGPDDSAAAQADDPSLNAAMPALERTRAESEPRRGETLDRSGDSRRVLSTPVAPANAPEARPAASYAVGGLVLDGEGRPAAGVPVRIAGAEDGVDSDGSGRFELTCGTDRATIEVADERWVAVRTGSWALGSQLEPVLVVAPSIDLTGAAVDAWGRPVEGARITLSLPEDFDSRFDRALDATFYEFWVAETVAAAPEDDGVSPAPGTFSLKAVPAIAGSTLRAAHPEHRPAVIAAPLHSADDLWIELTNPIIPAGHALNGIVRRPDGTPARDALVTMGMTTVHADPSGGFAIDLERAGDTAALRAVEVGLLPAFIERDHEPDADSTGWPDFLEVQLPGPALSIAGRVVDGDGNPRAGGRVWIADATPFGLVGAVPLRLESLMAGGEIPSEAIDSMARSKGGNFGSATPIYGPNALVYWVETDADGRFELPGLNDRKYTLNVLDRDLHWGSVAGPFAAGDTQVRITITDEVSYPRLRGRVLTARGDPVAGVKVTPWITAFDANEPIAGGSSSVMRFFLGGAAETDAQGRFELLEVPRAQVNFHVISDEIVPTYASVDQVTDPDRFEVRVLARVHLEVELTPRSGATPDAIRVKDAQGNVLKILQMRADGYSNHDSHPLSNGRSGVVTITSNATTLELLHQGAVVEAIAITPLPGTPLRILR